MDVVAPRVVPRPEPRPRYGSFAWPNARPGVMMGASMTTNKWNGHDLSRMSNPVVPCHFGQRKNSRRGLNRLYSSRTRSPTSDTHRGLNDARNRAGEPVAAGVGPDAVPFSVGIDTEERLIEDLDRALRAASS
jgi:hypothetical protein